MNDWLMFGIISWLICGLIALTILFALRPEKRIMAQARAAIDGAGVTGIGWARLLVYGLTWFACISCVIVWPLTVAGIIRWLVMRRAK